MPCPRPRRIKPTPRAGQRGTLYEIPITGMLLLVAAAVLVPLHPAFALLVPLGVLVFCLPLIWSWWRRWQVFLATRRARERLADAGWRPVLVLQGSWPDGCLLLFADGAHGAWIEPDGRIQCFAVADLQSMTRQKQVWTQLGGRTHTRHVLTLEGAALPGLPGMDPAPQGVTPPDLALRRDLVYRSRLGAWWAWRRLGRHWAGRVRMEDAAPLR